MDENSENPSTPLPLQTSQVFKKSILKPSQHDNLIQLCTPVHKGLKVKFETPHNVKKSTPTRFEGIRMLDEKENWIERTSVVTKDQHEEYLEMAQDIMLEVINKLPLEEKEETQNQESQDKMEEDMDTDDFYDAVMEIEENKAKEDDSSHSTAEAKEKDGEDDTQSSKEEIITADEKLQKGEDHKAENEPEEPSSPPLPVSKGVYNIDFDNLDKFNPFAITSAVQNSPVLSANEKMWNSVSDLKEVKGDEEEIKESNSSLSELQSVKDNPFIRLIESPAIKEKKNDHVVDVIVAEQSDDIFSQNFEDIDPFQPKKQLMNSPEMSRKTNSTEDVNSPEVSRKTNSTDDVSESSNVQVTIVPTNSPTNHIEPRKLSVNLDNSDKQTLCAPENNTQSVSQRAEESDVVAHEIHKDASESQIKEKKDSGFTDFDENMDPFATKTKVMNTPPKKKTDDATNLFVDEAMNSPVMPVLGGGSADPVVTKSEMASSPGQMAFGFQTNPFETKSKITNSPVKKSSELEESDPLSTQSKVANSHVKETVSENVDPFATNAKVANSPAKKTFTEDVDPIATNAKVANFPIKETVSENVDPFATNAKVANSPAKKTFTEDVDPFATNAKVANSPVKENISENVDPFATNAKVANSPAKKTFTEDVDPFATNAKVANSPVKENISENVDPFATNAKVANSPAKKTFTEDVDPFATNAKVANSPVKENISENVDPFATNAKVANSPVKVTVSEDVDPFATIVKVANSPAKKTFTEDVDPFATNAKVANSPVKETFAENVDPFATNAKDANSPVKKTFAEDVDPFATKSNIVNSPVRKLEEEVDPFATKSKIASSPTAKASEEINPFETKSEVVNFPLGVLDLDSLDPFAIKLNVENVPLLCDKPIEETVKQSKDLDGAQGEVGVSASKSTESTSEKLGKNNFNELLIDNEKCASPFSGQIENKIQNASFRLQDDPFKTPSGISKKTPQKSCPFTMGEFGLSDDDFKPASSTLFNDPADFDALEQFGCNKGIAESALSRMSLYLKFDPLVDLPVADPRRASIDVRRMSMKRGKLRKLEPEESFLLMGTPPRGVAQSRVIPVVKNQTPVNTKPETTDAAPVDLLFSNTPETRKDIVDAIKDSLSLNQAEGDGIIEVLQYTEADICRIKQNLAMEFQGILLDNQKEWSKKIDEKQAEMSKIREQHQKAEEDIKQMISVVKEYEIMINQLVEEREKSNNQLKETKEELQKANEKSAEYAQSMETIEGLFSALHQRYDKSREVLEHAKKNENMLKTCLEECQGKLKHSDERFLKLKQVAEEKLKAAHEELETVKSKSASESARLQAVVKRKEIQRETLEKSLEQKTKEFQDVTELCDQLMQKLESQ